MTSGWMAAVLAANQKPCWKIALSLKRFLMPIPENEIMIRTGGNFKIAYISLAHQSHRLNGVNI